MPGVRVDAGVIEGGEITVHYDPMIAKLIATAETREAARQRALAALRSYPILGIRTNVAFLIALLEHPRFVSGELDTHFLEHEGAAVAGVACCGPACGARARGRWRTSSGGDPDATAAPTMQAGQRRRRRRHRSLDRAARCPCLTCRSRRSARAGTA